MTAAKHTLTTEQVAREMEDNDPMTAPESLVGELSAAAADPFQRGFLTGVLQYRQMHRQMLSILKGRS